MVLNHYGLCRNLQQRTLYEMRFSMNISLSSEISSPENESAKSVSSSARGWMKYTPTILVHHWVSVESFWSVQLTRQWCRKTTLCPWSLWRMILHGGKYWLWMQLIKVDCYGILFRIANTIYSPIWSILSGIWMSETPSSDRFCPNRLAIAQARLGVKIELDWHFSYHRELFWSAHSKVGNSAIRTYP